MGTGMSDRFDRLFDRPVSWTDMVDAILDARRILRPKMDARNRRAIIDHLERGPCPREFDGPSCLEAIHEAFNAQEWV